MKSEKDYYLKLDIIRIISCLIVILYHLNIVAGGFLIVCTFFVLSGYLEGIFAFKSSDFSIKKYYKKRFVRLYLPLLFVISLTIIMVKITGVSWLNLKKEALSGLAGYNNFWQLQAKQNYFTKSIHSPLTHLWYISILMQYDLIFPFFVKLFKKIDNVIHRNMTSIFLFVFGIITAILFYFVGKNNDIMRIYYSTFLRSFSFIFGIFLASYHYQFKYRQLNSFRKFSDEIFLIYLAIIISICIFFYNNPNYYALNMILVTFFSCRLIEYATLKVNKKNVVTNLLNAFANISYEMYLVHFPVIFFIQKLKLAFLLNLIFVFGLSILISIVIHSLLNFKKTDKMKKTFQAGIFIFVVILGLFLIVIEKDSKKEIDELEKSLMDKTKIMEKKNQEYLNNVLKEEEDFQKMLENMDIEESEAITKQLNEMSIVGIGDSVFLDAVDKLYQKFPNGYFDGKVSRSLIAGLDILIDLKNSNKLPNNVILALSTNGDYSERLNKKLIEIVGERDIYWVNSVGADDPTFNEKFLEFAQGYSNIHIVDWERAASSHPEYFYADGIHPKGSGIDIYVNTIYDTIYDNMMGKYKERKEALLQSKKEENNKKLTFYGNDLLISSYELLNQKFEKAMFVTNNGNKFENIYGDLKSRIETKTLEHRIVFLFDKEITISEKEYKKIIDLCKDYEIYICNFSSLKYFFDYDNVKVIDFSSEFQKKNELFLQDKIHLSKKGIDVLVNKLYNELNH